MNKKLATCLIMAALFTGLISGGLIGGRVTGYFYHKMVSSFGRSAEAGRVSLDISVLNRLQTNNVTNAMDFLETDLDDSLIGLANWLSTNSTSLDNRLQFKALQNAKDYRTKFSYTNRQPEINLAVSNVLSFADPETSK